MKPLLKLAAILFAALLSLCTSTTLTAQDGPKYPAPESYPREITTDENGLQQFAENKPTKCPNCAGTGTATCLHCTRFDDPASCRDCKGQRKATCRVCAGKGELPDLLEHATCPGCLSAGFLNCGVCGGHGTQKVEGSGDRALDCVACRGDGGFDCGICAGKRLVEGPKIKWGKDDLKKLRGYRTQIADAMEKAQSFQFQAKNTRKEAKEYSKTLKPAVSVLPPLKRAPKALDAMIGKIMAGNVFVGAAENQAQIMDQWRRFNLYYLGQQLRIVDLEIARLEHNEKAKAEAKDK
jgi:hypothetical protein